jgi:hypothetical protein
MFMASFNASVDNYRTLLAEVEAGSFNPPNLNIDLGTPVSAGQYKGADLSYDELLDKLASRKFVGMSSDLRSHLIAYYEHRKPPSKEDARWAKVVEQRARLAEKTD